MSVDVTTTSGNSVTATSTGGTSVSFSSSSTSVAVTTPTSSSITVTSKGPKGDTGATGATGSTGATGATGATATAGDGIDIAGGEVSTDLKSNGGLVIESTELAVDLGASSITGTLAVGDGGTGATTLTDNAILTGTGTSAITAEANASYDGNDFTLASSTSAKPVLTLSNSNTDAVSSEIVFQKTATGADNDDVGKIDFKGDNDNNEVTSFATILAEIADASDSDEAGRLSMTVMASDGSFNHSLPAHQGRNAFTATGHGTNDIVDVTLGYGTASTTTVAGTLTMGSTAAMTNAGLLSVGNQTNITGTGALNGGSITSGFGNIDIGSSTFDTTGDVSTGVITPTAIKHTISGNNAGDYGTGAEILYGISNDSVTAGAIYVLRSGVWTTIDADVSSMVSQLVGVATIAAGNGDSSDGMIIKGSVTLASAYTAGSDAEGAIVYASATAGEATLTAPSSSAQFVRILGYSFNVSSKKMFLNPDSTFVKIA
tara:strand:+ start:4215 stop:5678 length:1464 start_codon:yes stop_codon:yes gene_type:complete